MWNKVFKFGGPAVTAVGLGLNIVGNEFPHWIGWGLIVLGPVIFLCGLLPRSLPPKHLLVMLILVLTSWVAFGADIWSRYKAADNQTKSVASDTKAGAPSGTNISGTNCTEVGHDCVHVEGNAKNLNLDAQNIGCNNTVKDCVHIGQKLIDPLRNEAAKWRIAKYLKEQTEGINGGCEAVIVRYQLPYAENYAQDLKEILHMSGWTYHEVFSTTTLPNALTTRSSFNNFDVRRCGDLLRIKLNSIDGPSSPQLVAAWDYTEKPTDYMQPCSAACVEISIGNEPQDVH